MAYGTVIAIEGVSALGRMCEFGAVSSSHWPRHRTVLAQRPRCYVSSTLHTGSWRRCQPGGSMTATGPRPRTGLPLASDRTPLLS